MTVLCTVFPQHFVEVAVTHGRIGNLWWINPSTHHTSDPHLLCHFHGIVGFGSIDDMIRAVPRIPRRYYPTP